MPRGRLDKNTMLARVFRLKNDLHNKQHDMSSDAYAEADHQLNLILDIINEHSQ
jgi:hypothetical protein